jgi:unsaturated rhamnogalacturonyl hydrolase
VPAKGLRERVTRAADVAAGLAYTRWFFGEALAFDGIAEVAAHWSDTRLWTRLTQMLDSWPARFEARADEPYLDVDAPMRALVALHRREGDATVPLATVRKLCNLVTTEPSHAGALLHDLEGYPNKMVFVDCIYYCGPELALGAEVLADDRLFDAAAEQTLAHVELLRTTGGLLCHVYDPGRATTNEIAWGRGNGWAMMGLVDTLELLPRSHVAWGRIHAALDELVATCVSLQDAGGHWHTILDDLASPLEPSIAAFFAAALRKGSRLGFVNGVEDVARRAWDATWHASAETGEAPTSMTEWPTWKREAYYERPSGVNPWGQGAFLRAAVEEKLLLRAG